MATKWKKSKKIISILSFVLGVSLLTGCILVNPFRVIPQKGDRAAAFSSKGSYVDTVGFRQEVSWLLRNLIRAGAGEKPLNYWDCYDEYDSFWYEVGWDTDWYMGGLEELWQEVGYRSYDEATIVQEEIGDGGTAVTEGEDIPWAVAPDAWEGDWEDDWEEEWPSPAGRAYTKEQLDKMIENFLLGQREDKNMLYQVLRDGKLLYENKGEIALDSYGVYLEFDGEKVRLLKDGQEQELYADPYFRGEGEQWQVPGYQNFPTQESWKNVTVKLWVKSEPLLYFSGQERYGYNLYRLGQRFANRKVYVKSWQVTLAISFILLLLSFLWRKERWEAQRRLGRKVSGIFLELRLGLLAVWACFLFRLLRSGFMLGDYLFWLGAVWTVWLLSLDIRSRPQFWKSSLLLRLVQVAFLAERKLPIQKKLVRRVLLPLAFTLGIVFFLFLIIQNEVWWMQWWYLENDILAVGVAACTLGLLLTLVYLAIKTGGLAEDLGVLEEQLNRGEKGERTKEMPLPKDSDLSAMSEELSRIYQGLEDAVEERTKSERMKVELVTNVSHDIKTPLTSIISYVDLLKEEENLPEELQEYVQILAQKSERLKSMVQDVFEVSKATTGQLPVQPERLDLAKLLHQTLADMQEQIENAPVQVKVQVPEEGVEILADGQRLYRVFQNLLQNALTYSLEGSRVFISLEHGDSLAVASVRNTSCKELDQNIDFTERFVRGDESRTDGGSGLGLSIAKSFTEACGGSFKVETIADLFVVTVSFTLVQ